MTSTTTLNGSSGDNPFTLTKPLAVADTLAINRNGGHDKLPDGTFHVRVRNKLGLVRTTPDLTVTVASGQIVTGKNFGETA